jgi:hypothetical protein
VVKREKKCLTIFQERGMLTKPILGVGVLFPLFADILEIKISNKGFCDPEIMVFIIKQGFFSFQVMQSNRLRILQAPAPEIKLS